MTDALPTTEWIWRDGELIPWDEANIHVMAHVVHYGSSVFEGIRCYDTPDGPAIFRLPEHLRRLADSCRIYRIAPAFDANAMTEACRIVVSRNDLRECYIRPVVLRGVGARGVHPGASKIETFIICWPWAPLLGDGRSAGVEACTSSWFRPAPNTHPTMAKAGGNYLNAQLIKMEAVANGYQEGIALSPDGVVSEASGQNLFMVRDGQLLTPALDGSILSGITRDSIITLAREMDIPVREQTIPREMLYCADELFFTGTASEVAPIRSLDRLPIGNGEVGPITTKLHQAFLAVARGAVPDRHGWRTPVNPASPARAKKVHAA